MQNLMHQNTKGSSALEKTIMSKKKKGELGYFEFALSFLFPEYSDSGQVSLVKTALHLEKHGI